MRVAPLTMTHTLARMVVLALGGTAVALGLNPLTPRPLSPMVPVRPASASAAAASCSAPHEAGPRAPSRMTQADAVAACVACSAAFVDARGEAAFAQGHVAGAVHLPPEGHPETPAVVEQLRGYPTVVVYDDDAGCRLAEGVAERLRTIGFADVRVLEGSWTAWEAAKGPSQAGACQVCDAPAAREAGR